MRREVDHEIKSPQNRRSDVYLARGRLRIDCRTDIFNPGAGNLDRLQHDDVAIDASADATTALAFDDPTWRQQPVLLREGAPYQHFVAIADIDVSVGSDAFHGAGKTFDAARGN